jgi:transcriptional regulator with XRE-family HTH domain
MAAISGHDATKREFARRLRVELSRKGWSQSDLARKMYGEDDNGGAKNRYQIGSYVHGHSLPRAGVLNDICKALGVAAEDLLPQGRPGGETEPMLTFEQIAPSTVRLAVPVREMSMQKAMRIMAILSEPDE